MVQYLTIGLIIAILSFAMPTEHAFSHEQKKVQFPHEKMVRLGKKLVKITLPQENVQTFYREFLMRRIPQDQIDGFLSLSGIPDVSFPPLPSRSDDRLFPLTGACEKFPDGTHAVYLYPENEFRRFPKSVEEKSGITELDNLLINSLAHEFAHVFDDIVSPEDTEREHQQMLRRNRTVQNIALGGISATGIGELVFLIQHIDNLPESGLSVIPLLLIILSIVTTARSIQYHFYRHESHESAARKKDDTPYASPFIIKEILEKSPEENTSE